MLPLKFFVMSRLEISLEYSVTKYSLRNRHTINRIGPRIIMFVQLFVDISTVTNDKKERSFFLQNNKLQLTNNCAFNKRRSYLDNIRKSTQTVTCPQHKRRTLTFSGFSRAQAAACRLEINCRDTDFLWFFQSLQEHSLIMNST